MRVLTIGQPTASALSSGLIQYEVKTKSTAYRGPLAIHAGKRHLTQSAYKAMADDLKPAELMLVPHYDLLPFGCVIALCDLVDCIELTDDFMDQVDDVHFVFGEWVEGSYALKLANMQKLVNPVTMKGKQGLWRYNDKRRTVRVVPMTGRNSERLRPADRRFHREQRVIG